MAKVYFKEKQRYSNKWVLVILGIVCLLTIFGGVKFLLKSPADYFQAIFLLVTALALGVLIWWLTRLKMKVVISEKNIKFKMSPIHLKKQVVPWEDVEKYEVVKTSEAAQWSGGNITFNDEKKYSMTGRNGLAFKTKNGEYYFIGCKDVEALRSALAQINLT